MTSSGASYSLGSIFNDTAYTVSGLTVTNNAITVNVAAATAPSALYWKGGYSGGANNWSASDGATTSNWTTDQAGMNPSVLTPGATTTVNFSATGATNESSMILGANTSILGLVNSDSTSAVNLTADGNTLTIGTGGIVVNSGALATTLATPVVLNGNQPWTNSSSNAVTLSGLVSGTGAVTVTGGGTIALSNTSNSFSGGLAISSGTVQIPAISNVSTAGPLGSQTSVTLGANTTTGTIEYTSASAGSTTLPFTLTTGGTGAFQIDNSAANVTLSGLISGGGTLSKTGPGTLTVSNSSNSYSGGTSVSGGTLLTTADSQLGSTSIAITLSNGGNWTGATGADNKPIILGTGGGTFSPNGNYSWGGTITGGTGLTVNSGDWIPAPSSAVNIGTLTITGTATRILTGNGNTNGANFLPAGTTVNLTNGGTLDIGDTGTRTFTSTVPMNFASGTAFSQRGTTINVTTVAAGGGANFPSAGTMVFQIDDTAAANLITSTGAWTTLTGNLTIQVGGTYESWTSGNTARCCSTAPRAAYLTAAPIHSPRPAATPLIWWAPVRWAARRSPPGRSSWAMAQARRAPRWAAAPS